MAVIITATITARCWKQHTCSACRGVYRYLFERTAVSSGGARDDVRDAAQARITRAMRDQVDECPCPTCGALQPDMAAKDKLTWHTAFTAVTGFILLLVLFAAGQGSLPLEVAGQVAAAVAGFGVLGHLLAALGNPNRRPERNRRDAQARVAAGTLEAVRDGGRPDYAALPLNLTLAHVACLLAVLAAPFAFLAVVYVAREHPMPVNAGLKPDVVGPGDEVTIPVPTSILSVNGVWRATAAARVLNADEAGAPATLPALSDNAGWPRSMAPNDRKSPLGPVQAWVKVAVPDDAALGGKTLRLQLALAVSYPTEAGKALGEKTETVTKEVELRLADVEARQLAKETWRVGRWVGLGGCVLGGLGLALLARRLRGCAIPHQVLPLWAPGGGREASGAAGLKSADFGLGGF